MLKNHWLTGFTLTEVLVTIAVFVLVIGAIYSVNLFNQKAYLEGEIAVEITQNGRVILERMTREIRQAKEIAPALPVERVNATDEIIFEDGHIETPYHYIHYFKSNDEVKREVIGYYVSGDPDQTLVAWKDATPPLDQKTLPNGEAKVVGEWVDNLEFWGGDLVEIALTLKNGDRIINFKNKVFGRNL